MLGPSEQAESNGIVQMCHALLRMHDWMIASETDASVGPGLNDFQKKCRSGLMQQIQTGLAIQMICNHT